MAARSDGADTRSSTVSVATAKPKAADEGQANNQSRQIPERVNRGLNIRADLLMRLEDVARKRKWKYGAQGRGPGRGRASVSELIEEIVAENIDRLERDVDQ